MKLPAKFSVLSQTSAVMSLRLAAIILAFGIQVLLTRTMSLSGFGAYTYVATWIGLLSLVATAGLDLSVVRYLPGYLKLDQREEAVRLINGSRFFTFAAGSLAACLLLLTTLSPSLLHTDLSIPFRIGSAAIPAMALLRIRSAEFRSIGEPVLSQAVISLWRPLTFAFAIAAVALLNRGHLKPSMAIEVFAITAFGTFMLAASYRRWPRDWRVRIFGAPTLKTRWLATALPLATLSWLNLLLTRSDLLLLGVLRPLDDVAQYKVASSIAALSVIGLEAANYVLAPKISAHFSVHQISDIQLEVTRAARIGFVVSVLMSLLLLGTAKRLLLIFGTGYVGVIWPLGILVVGQLANAAAGPAGYLLAMTGKEKFVAISMSIGVLLNIALDVVLIPRYGPLGAAIGTATALSMSNLIRVVYSISQLRISPLPFRHMIRINREG